MSEKRQTIGMDIVEDDSFSLNGFQIVRGEFFAHTYEPSITFADCKVYVNTACIRKLSDFDYIQILVNPELKKLAVRPCAESDKDSFRWCSATEKRSPKQITCRIFFAKVFTLMGWDPKDRYKLLGKLIRTNGQLVFAFDMTSPEVTVRTIDENGKISSTRTPSYPADWQNQFGIPVTEHEGQLLINIFNGNAVFGLEKDPVGTKKKEVIASIPKESEGPQYEQLTLLGTGVSANTDDRSEEVPTENLQENPAHA